MNSKKVRTENERSIYLYDQNDEHDTNVYKGGYAKQMLEYQGRKDVFDHTFVTSEDLLLPSQKEKVDTFLELVKNDPIVARDLELRKDYFSAEGQYFTSYWDDLDKDSQTSLNRDYRMFISTPNIQASEAGRHFIKALSDKGYNAMFDDNDANQYLSAHNPLYVFSQSSLEKPSSKGVKISSKEMETRMDLALEEHRRSLRARGIS